MNNKRYTRKDDDLDLKVSGGTCVKLTFVLFILLAFAFVGIWNAISSAF